MGHKKPSFIEKLAEGIGLIPNLHKDADSNETVDRLTEEGSQTRFPPPEKWMIGKSMMPRHGQKKRKGSTISFLRLVSIARVLAV